MALTMVHLLVADRWAAEHPAYMDSPEYYLGAVSPDAIHIRDKDDIFRLYQKIGLDLDWHSTDSIGQFLENKHLNNIKFSYS